MYFLKKKKVEKNIWETLRVCSLEKIKKIVRTLMIKITLIKEGSDKQETTISYVAKDRKQEVL